MSVDTHLFHGTERLHSILCFRYTMSDKKGSGAYDNDAFTFPTQDDRSPYLRSRSRDLESANQSPTFSTFGRPATNHDIPYEPPSESNRYSLPPAYSPGHGGRSGVYTISSSNGSPPNTDDTDSKGRKGYVCVILVILFVILCLAAGAVCVYIFGKYISFPQIPKSLFLSCLAARALV